MAIGLEEKKSSLQTILIVSLVILSLGALVFFATKTDFLKGKTQQSVSVEFKPEEVGIDFVFLKSGAIAGLKDFPEFATVMGTSSEIMGNVGRPNPFIPYQATEITGVKKVTSTQPDNSSK